MKILFIVPASDMRRRFFYRIGGRFYGKTNSITGPLILGHILKKKGYLVEVYEELYKNLNYKKLQDYDVIGIYTMTSNAPRAYEIADLYRNKFHKRVIIGGMHASVKPEEALLHADQVVVGEAESVIADVIEGKLTDKIVKAKPIDNLDTIPFPDYTLLKTPAAAANVMTTRGCPFNCGFCTTTRMFHPYRERSPENVIQELRLYKKMGFKYVNFEDDNFTANKKRAKTILRRMIKEKLVFKETFFFGRTDMANDIELLELLRDAHLKRVLIGIETLKQESLDYINKKQTINDIKKVGKILSKYKIKLIASIVLGLDYDNVKNIKEAIKFAIDINSYQLQPAILTPFPGTPVWRQFKKEGRIITEDWQYYDMISVVFKPKNMTPWELQNEFFYAIKSFYSFKAALKIFKTYGLEAGIRRIGLWLISFFSLLYLKYKSRKRDGNYFYYLKNL